jgi:hypothetical protein
MAPPEWASSLLLPLRHASLALSNATYETIACALFNSTALYTSQRLNLIAPPEFDVTQDPACDALRTQKKRMAN